MERPFERQHQLPACCETRSFHVGGRLVQGKLSSDAAQTADSFTYRSCCQLGALLKLREARAKDELSVALSKPFPPATCSCLYLYRIAGRGAA